MNIRTWKQEDIKDLIKLCEMMWAESKFRDIPFSEERLQKQFDYLLKNNFKGTGFIAIENDEIIGAMVIMLSKYFFGDDLFCFELLLYVTPEKRKSIRVPIRLINASTDWAREKGCKEFRPGSSVGIKSAKVEKLYNFMKFETIGNVFTKRL